MLFNSVAFAIFLTITFLLYYACPLKYRNGLLLLVSFYFYFSMSVACGFILVGVILATYAISRAMDLDAGRVSKKAWLLFAVIALVGMLFVFKYLGFAMELVASLFALIGIPVGEMALRLLLPTGISFYTFQTLGYLIDVYRGKYKPEKNLIDYALFVSFFPQIMSGPIGRGDKLLPEIKKPRPFSFADASYGIKQMAVGYFKKLVVATSLALVVDPIYNDVDGCKGIAFLVATFMFAIQIYCDFSGYTDIAIGTARLFGIRLSDNFKSPYFSTSIKEFWSRWHISLSTWFRDYVYIPLGGNRVPKWRHYLNLMITFLVSGLWHGAALTYIVWGALHGMYQIVETMIWGKKKEIKSVWGQVFHCALTFVLISIAWVFFRANSMRDAYIIFRDIPMGIRDFSQYMQDGAIFLNLTWRKWIFVSIPIVLLGMYDWASLKMDVLDWITTKPAAIKYTVYVLFLLIILLFSEKGVSTSFIYMQF